MMREHPYRTVSYVAILMLICVVSFLVAKYIVKSGIDDEEVPIDTSTRI